MDDFKAKKEEGGMSMGKKKMKTNRSAAKRFRVTRKGKVMREHAYAWHKTGKKRRSALRRLKRKGQVSAAEKNRVLKLLGMK